ncbi:MAG TPA: hypothetical protein VHQ43_01825 [Solirubrobacterales bacterium]|jgi:hypothetical protein|nr:hypothetical protein [Solirubrobacterales bacterium]
MAGGLTSTTSYFDTTIGVAFFNVAPPSIPGLTSFMVEARNRRHDSPQEREGYIHAALAMLDRLHYPLVTHEWGHTLQAITHPALYLRCLRELSLLWGMLDIGADLLEACDATPVEVTVAEVEHDPQLVRQFQGCLGFRFPDRGAGQTPWENPAVLAWGRKAHTRVPHLLYYMCPEPWAGAMALVCVAFANQGRITGDSPGEELDREVFEALLSPLSERLLAAAAFASRMADDWRPIVTELLAPLGPEFADAIANTVEASMALSGDA